MPKTGLKHIVGAKLDESKSTPTYTDGVIIGKAISANVSIEVNSAVLYADDSVAESIKSFKNGKISLNLDDLQYEVQGMLLGHAVSADTLSANANDIAPYLGIGFYGAVIRSGVTKYRAVWFYKVQFGEFSDESKTKGDNIEFITPTIEGSLMALPNGDWKDETIVTTEDAALAWLDAKAGIANKNTKNTKKTEVTGNE
jgi:phi13 family phage major tail protein